MNGTLVITDMEINDDIIDIVVDFDYEYDAGYWHYNDGYPPSESLTINSIINYDTGEEIDDKHISAKQMSYIEDKISSSF